MNDLNDKARNNLTESIITLVKAHFPGVKGVVVVWDGRSIGVEIEEGEYTNLEVNYWLANSVITVYKPSK